LFCAMAEKVKVSLREVRLCAALQCTDQEVAAVLGLRLHRWRRLKVKNVKVREAWERGKYLGRKSLRRHQFNLAKHNAQMGIHLGKVWLGQRDVQTIEHSGRDGGPVEFDARKLSQDDRDTLRDLLTRGGAGR